MSWRSGPLKRWLSLNDSGVWGNDPDGASDVEVLRSTDIAVDGSWEIDEPAVRAISAVEQASKSLQTGDLVVVKSSGSEAHLGKTAIVTQGVAARGACFANFVQRLRPSPSAEGRYVWYVLNSKRASEEMSVLGNTSTGLRNLNGTIIGQVTFPGPPLVEQRAIADYLDTETARIDAIMDKKRRLLALAEERVRSALEVSMRSSSWTRPSLSYLLAHRVSDGPHETPEFIDQGIPFLSVDAFSDDSLSFSGCRFVSPEDHRRYSAKVKPRRGDVLMTKAAAIGRVALVQTDRDFNIWSPIAVLRPNPELLRPEYLAHVLRSDDLQTQIELAATSNTQQNLAMRDISSLRIPLPPLDEQARLAGVAEDRLALQRVLRGRMREQISRLEEHRQALITAAVTGELEVPGVAA